MAINEVNSVFPIFLLKYAFQKYSTLSPRFEEDAAKKQLCKV
jgi:hypothetical protein